MPNVGPTPTQAPVRSPGVELWFARHAIVSPLKTWKQSTGGRSADVAFRAVAADERLLFTIDGKAALAMAEQAEGIATSLKEMGSSLSDVLHSVCDIVLLHVGNFKAAEKKFSQDLGRPGRTVGAMPAKSLGDRSTSREVKALLEYPDLRCPQFSNAAGRTVASIVSEMGAGALANLDHAMGNKLAVTCARFVARSLRRITFKGALSRTECLAALQIVEEWASLHGSQLMKVGYEGSAGTLADCARGLAYDAISCLELSAALPHGKGGGEYGRWECAVERHSYAAVALDFGMLQHMPFDKARMIAAAAIRHVAASSNGRSTEPLLEVPAFINSRPPQVIQTMLMRLFPEGAPTGL